LNYRNWYYYETVFDNILNFIIIGSPTGTKLWVPCYTQELNPAEFLFSHWFLNPGKSSGVKWHV